MTLHLDSVERNNSAEPTEIDTIFFFKSHHKKYQLKFFLTCYILHETLKKGMKSIDFPHTSHQLSLALMRRSNFTYISKVIPTLQSNLKSFPELLHPRAASQTSLYEK